MELSQPKLLSFCVAVLALAGCGAASKTTEYVNPQSRQVASVIGDAAPGDRVSLPPDSGLGINSVVVDQIYVSASGRQCRRLRTVAGTPIQRVACQDGGGVWSLARDLSPVSSTASTPSSTSLVRSSDGFSQPLVTSSGSVMLLNDQDKLSGDSTSLHNADSLDVSAAQSLMRSTAEPQIISLDEYAVEQYAPPAAAQLAVDSSVNSLLPISTEPKAINLEQYAVKTYAPPAVTQLAIDRQVDSSLPSGAEPQAIGLDEYSATVDTEPYLGSAVEDTIQTRAESVIISYEEHAVRSGATPLSVGIDESQIQIIAESPIQVIAEPATTNATGFDNEAETVQRTVNVNETLWSFAKRTTGNALNWKAIAQINGIIDEKFLASGTQLLIPAKLVGPGG